MRIIVAGWRDCPRTHRYRELVISALLKEIDGDQWRTRVNMGTVTIVDGACHLGGIDRIAHEAALELGATSERHPARGHPTQDFGDWPACGPRRNEYMASLGGDIGLLFPHIAKHRGTLDMAKALTRHGIRSQIYPLSDPPAMQLPLLSPSPILAS